MEVIKADGTRAPFEEQKVRNSIKRTGATPGVIDNVMRRVTPQVYDGITTKELYKIVRTELGKDSGCFSCRYNLREGILKLGPAGFKFEKYVASILNAYRYKAHVPVDEIEGSCVSHEVDVVAEKDGRRMFIEAKFRNDFSRHVNLKDTMATWSRFLDLVDGAAIGKGPHFDEPWIVTNASFSDRARQFGTCKGIHLIGWNFPKDNPLATMVDHLSLYPITVIDGLSSGELEAFSNAHIMLCRETLDMEPEDVAERTGLSLARVKELMKLCKEIVEGEDEHKHEE